ncbi:MAG: 50S ribosomal protein L29, partial [Chloroflexi bacterium]|nr:50S ribosomal protein L29 [Chloroflexota bacterium]
MAKIEEIRALTNEELRNQLEASHRELFDLRFRLSTRQLVNHREIPRVKKKIAAINTILRERELGIRSV